MNPVEVVSGDSPVIPFLFPGTLPALSGGTDSGVTCAPEVEQIVAGACRSTSGCDHAINGRFRGGWTTRHYGRPDEDVHTIQTDLAQRAYLSAEAAPWGNNGERAGQLREVLRPSLTDLDRFGSLSVMAS